MLTEYFSGFIRDWLYLKKTNISMKSLHLFAPFLLLMFLASCSEDEPKSKKSGYFKLAQVQSPGTRSTVRNARVGATEETSFNLGEIKASREFYFMLVNGGETDITGVELETNNDAFIISPASISLLPSVTSEAESLVPLISLGIEHGPKLNGVGYTDLLPMGTNTAMLTITGSTVENGETVLLESTFTITVDAKTMDITLYSDDQEIDMSVFPAFFSGSEFESGLPGIPGYVINPENFKIKNTGNTDVTVKIVHQVSESQQAAYELEPNESATINFPAPTTADYYLSQITVDGKGTVSERLRLRQGLDGKGYLIVYTNSPE